MRALADKASNHTFERPMHDLDHHPFVDERTWVVLQLARDQPADAFDFMVGNRRRLALEGDNIDDASAFEDSQPRVGNKPREAIAGKQRPVDLLFAILPAAPAGNSGQRRLDALRFELLADDLLVARAGPDREPVFVGLQASGVGLGHDQPANGGLAAARAARPCS